MKWTKTEKGGYRAAGAEHVYEVLRSDRGWDLLVWDTFLAVGLRLQGQIVKQDRHDTMALAKAVAVAFEEAGESTSFVQPSRYTRAIQTAYAA